MPHQTLSSPPAGLVTQELLALLRRGIQPVVTFLAGIERPSVPGHQAHLLWVLGGYAKPGMRARILSASDIGDNNEVVFTFDFEAFSEHNRAFECQDYRDARGIARLSARQAGRYQPVASLPFDACEGVATSFSMELDS